MKVAICCSEMFPFAKTGGLADVAGALPKYLGEYVDDVVVFLPLYGIIDRKLYNIEHVEDNLYQTVIGKNVKVFLIENDAYFKRDELYGDVNGDYADNFERYVYFCEQILETIDRMNLEIDIAHCHDWHTAMIPVLIKKKYHKRKNLKDIQTLLTIHNLAHQGLFEMKKYESYISSFDAHQHFEYYGKINLLKAGIIYTDALNTVSPNYAREILTEKFGCGLEGVLKNREKDLVGIINGLDYDYWSSETDTMIDHNYGVKDFERIKRKNKKALQKQLGLKEGDSTMLVGFVGRVAEQKGIELICKLIESLNRDDKIQLIIQGVGDAVLEKRLKALSSAWVKFISDFDEPLAHKIYAGSDVFLMPSRFEPCGLGQMISMSYATLPLVYRTGGLVDTVIAYGKNKADGFMFNEYTFESFNEVFKQSVKVFKNKSELLGLRTNAIKKRFSWDVSAKQYNTIYQSLMIRV